MTFASAASSSASNIFAQHIASSMAGSAIIDHTPSTAKAAASAASTAASATMSSWATNDALLNGIATLLGALIGGYVASHVAYRLHLRATEKKEREQGLVEAHQMMFCIVQQLNTILLVWGHFSQYVDNPGRFINVSATTPFDLNRYVLDVSKMVILLDHKAGRKILYDLNIAQEAYREALVMLNERSILHRGELQPTLEKINFNGQNVTTEMVMDVIGERLVLTMIGVTDGCYMMMHKAFLKLTNVKDTAREYVVQRFGTDDFTKIVFPDTNGIENEPKRHYPKRPLLRETDLKYFYFSTAYNWRSLWPDT